MSVFSNLRTVANIQIGGKTFVNEAIRRTSQIISASGVVNGTALFETVIFTSPLPVVYSFPALTAKDDGATCMFINATGGDKTINASIDGSLSSITISNQHDHITLRFAANGSTWYVV
jgi:hypothetical protein